jgi:hypothetical protein
VPLSNKPLLRAVPALLLIGTRTSNPWMTSRIPWTDSATGDAWVAAACTGAISAATEADRQTLVFFIYQDFQIPTF